MAVRQIGIGSWHSTLTGDTYDSELAARHYDSLERMRSTPESAGSKLLESMTAEQIKSLVTELNIQADQPERNQDWKQVQQDFVNANPDFVPNPANGSALTVALIERGKLTSDGSYLGTMDDLQEVYADLASKNLIQLRAGARKPKRLDEKELRELPMGDLMDRARGW